MSKPLISVVTPTYNRADTLPRVYRSLCEQSGPAIEWLVVDDGSVDNTRNVLDTYAHASSFPVRTLHIHHGGKHVALNAGIPEARGAFIVLLDSDDWLAPNALARFMRHWENMPDASVVPIAGIAARCATEDGVLVGTPLPKSPLDSNTYDIRLKHRVKGDLIHMVCTDVLREFPLPVFPGETNIPMGVLWGRMAQTYALRFVDDVLGYIEYRADGLTANIARNRLTNIRGTILAHEELITHNPDMRFTDAVVNYARYMRFARRGRVSGDEQKRVMTSAFIRFLAAPLAALMYWRDSRRLAHPP